MNPRSKPSTTRRSPRANRLSFVQSAEGQQFVVVTATNGKVITTVPVPKHTEQEPVAQQEIPPASMRIYTADDIRRAGGIDALSKAIGNDKPIKAPRIEFTDEEWAAMLNELSSHR